MMIKITRTTNDTPPKLSTAVELLGGVPTEGPDSVDDLAGALLSTSNHLSRRVKQVKSAT